MNQTQTNIMWLLSYVGWRGWVGSMKTSGVGVGEEGKGGRVQEPTREEVNFNKDLAYAECHNKTPYFIQLKYTKNKNRKAKAKPHHYAK